MWIVKFNRSCSLDNLIRDVAARVTIQLAMIILMWELHRLYDDSIRNGCRDSSTSLVVGWFRMWWSSWGWNAATRGTTQFAMVVVIHSRCSLWNDSACDDHRDFINAAARGTIQFAMVVVSHKGGRSWNDSDCDDHRGVKTHPLVKRFHSRWLS